MNIVRTISQQCSYKQRIFDIPKLQRVSTSHGYTCVIRLHTSTSWRMDTTKTSSSEFLHPISTPGASPLGASDGQNKRISPLLVTISTYCFLARMTHDALVALSQICYRLLSGGVERFRVPQCAQWGGPRGRKREKGPRNLSPLLSIKENRQCDVAIEGREGQRTTTPWSQAKIANSYR